MLEAVSCPSDTLPDGSDGAAAGVLEAVSGPSEALPDGTVGAAAGALEEVEDPKVKPADGAAVAVAGAGASAGVLEPKVPAGTEVFPEAALDEVPKVKPPADAAGGFSGALEELLDPKGKPNDGADASGAALLPNVDEEGSVTAADGVNGAADADNPNLTSAVEV